MYDLNLSWGGDLSLAPNNDLALVSDDVLTQQRVLRRILTTAPDYFWEPSYGGGLGQVVGSPAQRGANEARIQAQMALVASVAESPPPTVSVVFDSPGTFAVSTSYFDSGTQLSSALTFMVAP